MRPVIGVTPGFAGPSAQREFCRTTNVLYCDQNYLKRIEEAGGIPILLPQVEDDEGIHELAQGVDGLLLTGGEDVHPNHYGQRLEVQTGQISDARDTFELRLTKEFLAGRKPMLAICRGIQLLNVAAGGTLIQDLPVQVGSVHHSQRENTALPTHEVRLEVSSRLAGVFGATVIEVNSHHHQAVDCVADGFRAAGWSEEGIVEVIEHNGAPYRVGVQWHPERLTSRYALQHRLFADFVDACRKAADGRG